MDDRVTLKEAARFHGHLGPYLVLGILAGEVALKKLKCKKYFGLEVEVQGATQKPKSCLIDGLQLSTGATYGKGNIKKIKSNKLQVFISNLKNNRKIKITLTDDLRQKIDNLKGHRDSELLAKKLFKIRSFKIFNLTPNT